MAAQVGKGQSWTVLVSHEFVKSKIEGVKLGTMLIYTH